MAHDQNIFWFSELELQVWTFMFWRRRQCGLCIGWIGKKKIKYTYHTREVSTHFIWQIFKQFKFHQYQPSNVESCWKNWIKCAFQNKAQHLIFSVQLNSGNAGVEILYQYPGILFGFCISLLLKIKVCWKKKNLDPIIIRKNWCFCVSSVQRDMYCCSYIMGWAVVQETQFPVKGL